MPAVSPPDSAAYRVTLFFGPEPIDGRPDVLACVFNVKKRSWKAGVQVSVEIGLDQLAALQERLHLRERLARAFETLTQEDRASCEMRVADLFTQAVCRCKLDVRLDAGLGQENQRVSAGDLASELAERVADRREYVLTYILTELDLVPPSPSASS